MLSVIFVGIWGRSTIIVGIREIARGKRVRPERSRGRRRGGSRQRGIDGLRSNRCIIKKVAGALGGMAAHAVPVEEARNMVDIVGGHLAFSGRERRVVCVLDGKSRGPG